MEQKDVLNAFFPFEDEISVQHQCSSPIQQVQKPEQKIPVFIILLIIAGVLLTADGITSFIISANTNPSEETLLPTTIPYAVPTKTKAPTLLTITPVPSGATVYISGRKKGVRPVTVELIPPSNYVVYMELAGYEPSFSSVSLNEQEQKTMQVVFTDKVSFSDAKSVTVFQFYEHGLL